MVLYAEKDVCQAGGRFMEIRQATATDGLLLSSLCMDVQSLHARNYPDLFKMPESDDFAVSFFDVILADPAMSIFIAEENGQALGYIVCKLIERQENPFKFATRFLEVDQISVRPSAQGRGIGAALIKQAEVLAEKSNVQRIHLDSWGFNTDAHRFFEKMGFEKFNHRFWKNL
jgi:ribosomal protein S18 acetylase RimI-like enzyme